MATTQVARNSLLRRPRRHPEKVGVRYWIPVAGLLMTMAAGTPTRTCVQVVRQSFRVRLARAPAVVPVRVIIPCAVTRMLPGAGPYRVVAHLAQRPRRVIWCSSTSNDSRCARAWMASSTPASSTGRTSPQWRHTTW